MLLMFDIDTHFARSQKALYWDKFAIGRHCAVGCTSDS